MYSTCNTSKTGLVHVSHVKSCYRTCITCHVTLLYIIIQYRCDMYRNFTWKIVCAHAHMCVFHFTFSNHIVGLSHFLSCQECPFNLLLSVKHTSSQCLFFNLFEFKLIHSYKRIRGNFYKKVLFTSFWLPFNITVRCNIITSYSSTMTSFILFF